MKKIKLFENFEDEDQRPEYFSDENNVAGVTKRTNSACHTDNHQTDRVLTPSEKFRKLLREKAPIIEFKKLLRKEGEKLKLIVNGHMLLSLAAEYNRKDIVEYLFEIDFAPDNLNSTKRWVATTTKLTQEEKDEMISFLEMLENENRN